MARRFKSFRSEGDQIYADPVVTRTKDEELLRILSGKAERRVTIHICPGPADCRQVHAHSFQEVDLKRLPWLTNLEGVREERGEADELARLGREQMLMEEEKKPPGKKEAWKDKKRKRKEEREEEVSQGKQGRFGRGSEWFGRGLQGHGYGSQPFRKGTPDEKG